MDDEWTYNDTLNQTLGYNVPAVLSGSCGGKKSDRHDIQSSGKWEKGQTEKSRAEVLCSNTPSATARSVEYPPWYIHCGDLSHTAGSKK